MTGNASVEEEKVSWENADHVQNKGETPENGFLLKKLIQANFHL